MKVAKGILVDKRNIDELREQIKTELASATIVGLDLETQDVGAHEGIKKLRKETEEGDKTAKGKQVFDWRRMVITGLSIYPDGAENSYYFNLAHADVSNRLDWKTVEDLLRYKQPDSAWICHNAPFEITCLKNCLNFDLDNVICTLQMAVSAYGPDEYPRELFIDSQFGEITQLFQEASVLFSKHNPDNVVDIDPEEVKSSKLNPRQQDLLNKVIGKVSNASYSYNGLVYDMSYGYGLKKAIKSFFDVKMTTFEETLGDKRHMGELTGDEVASYGCDDSFWAVQLFYKLYEFMEKNCPEAVNTFFEQENPMIYVYSDIRQNGMKVNTKAIETRRTHERKVFAQSLREIKAVIRNLLPFDIELDEKLAKYEKWYATKGQEYRKRLVEWAMSDDEEDDFKMACQVSSPVSNAWAGKKCPGLSINHYYQTRIMMYDLTRMPAIIYKGKVASDSECRGELLDKIKSQIPDNPQFLDQLENSAKLVKLMGEISSVEQRMKLYLTPYLLLTDPETQRMYPEVSSMLASRRMAASNPNPMQLAKRGESTYVRGFYEPDDKEEVIVSLDWSQIELVLIGEFSGDREFFKAYGQLPYNDLHLGTTADVLAVMIPEVTEDMIRNMHKMEASQLPAKLLVKPNGELLTPDKAKKFWRTEVGKGSNFNYWYSGALATIAEKLGWSTDMMWKATECYRERFPEGEKWRVDTIEKARWDGFILLPDGHRRVKYEATYEWQNIARRMFDAYSNEGIKRFGDEIIRATKTRAGNQIVNSLIQGTSATLAKRSILRINAKIKEQGIRARFKMPIHDELVYSVHKDDVVEFIKLAKTIMCDHPDIIKNLKVYATAAIGLTFEPFHEKSAPFGQIEIDEAPAILGYGDGVILNDDQINETVAYLFKQRAV